MTLLHASGGITHYGTSSVGSGAILVDSDDGTYVNSAIGGGNGFVVGLDALSSAPADDTPITLHLRISATGGWAEGAASEVWLSTDAAGGSPYVGFADGSVVTVGFDAIGYPADGTAHDVSYLLTDAALATWGVTRPGVLAELVSGSYLFVLDSYREATATAAPMKVYEAWLEVGVQAALYPLRRWPPNGNGGSGPTRHYPRSPGRRGAY